MCVRSLYFDDFGQRFAFLHGGVRGTRRLSLRSLFLSFSVSLFLSHSFSFSIPPQAANHDREIFCPSLPLFAFSLCTFSSFGFYVPSLSPVRISPSGRVVARDPFRVRCPRLYNFYVAIVVTSNLPPTADDHIVTHDTYIYRNQNCIRFLIYFIII